MIFNLAILAISVVGLLLVLVLIDAVFGSWFQED